MAGNGVGIVGIGTYFPDRVETGADVAGKTGIPREIVEFKMGLKRKHVASAADTTSMMAAEAGRRALEDAGVAPEDVDLVIFHGSEHKDHVVWSAAVKIQYEIGAVNAYAFEVYALCAGAPIAFSVARAMMLTDPRLRHVLLTTASREDDLIDYSNQRARFMFNFGAGGGAVLLRRGDEGHQVLETSVLTDGSLSETVVMVPGEMPAADPMPASTLTGMLDVLNGEFMAERLGEVSLPNFVRVITEAVERSGYGLGDLRFLGITHMKRSFYMQILEAVGLTPEQSVYLDEYGHIQSVDQALALQLGEAQGKIRPGDLVVIAGAGTGYTWSATAILW